MDVVVVKGEGRGDTVWATVAAYATLPPVLCGPADQLWALNANAYDYAATRPNAMARQVQRIT